MTITGEVVRIAGAVVSAKNLAGARMYDVVRVGDKQLVGEIVVLEGDVATIQVYEETEGIAPGEPVTTTGMPLSAELGPGLLGTTYDGIQRPLEILLAEGGDFIVRGVHAPGLRRECGWDFTPAVRPGDRVVGGDTLGAVVETEVHEHRVMVPPTLQGTIAEIAPEGRYTVDDVVATLKGDGRTQTVRMRQYWPVRQPRPVLRRLEAADPLISGQRVIDTFFPLVKGGTAALPGPFGAGKTVVQHQLAKYVNADIIVYVGCGERGNEMADVLRQFPALVDPTTGKSLMDRTVLIGNTSNMPVAAREASVYTGITIAEYYRDMGYDVALMADSTSRWAEAMREISGRLEEMPGEQGYPAYLASRLADFYERAGRMAVLGSSGRTGSVTVIGSVSPPGGDFSEPVTQNTLRVVRVLWALDADLAHERHFPSINWLTSYSAYAGAVQGWWTAHAAPRWEEYRTEMMGVLQAESELLETVQLVGEDVLPEEDRLVLVQARLIRDGFLIQSAFHPVDTYCPAEKQYLMLDLLARFYRHGQRAVAAGVSAAAVGGLAVKSRIERMPFVPDERFAGEHAVIAQEMDEAFAGLTAGKAAYGVTPRG
ncbi:V-type ATP synthase subunit A [Methanoculleus sp. FWC-SCC1]|uniref:A-type ATP synthase subunit A n=1 Tax=Methanoculleus frigidifontis TaxID=2584085 RepID=A0ABT8M760_9EURY|nr:V-type ATP synthase subunit A [Methanoculleus sp. FWC-SCC1]MDN7023771.1 V-type ATP synthase subunit A [Methanoculleus sp. FWC-SCC1]